MSELVCHFGKHEGVDMGNIPTGYLRWATENIKDPKPLPQYQKNEDGSQKSVEEVTQMTQDMATFLAAANVELKRRDEDGE